MMQRLGLIVEHRNVLSRESPGKHYMLEMRGMKEC